MPSALATDELNTDPAATHEPHIGPDPQRAALLEHERLRPVPKPGRPVCPLQSDASSVHPDPAHVTQRRRAALLAALRRGADHAAHQGANT